MRTAVWEMLLTSSVMIIGILGLRKLTMGKISMKLRYGLWLLVAVRLLTPLSLGTSPVSVMNLFPGIRQESSLQSAAGKENLRHEDAGQGETGAQAVQGEADGEETAFFMHNPSQTAAKKRSYAVFDGGKTQGKTADGTEPLTAVKAAYKAGDAWHPVMMGIWLSGFLLVGGYLFWMRFRFVRYLRRKRQEVSEEEIPDAMGERLAGRGMRVYRVKGLPSPCLVGRHIYIGKETPDGEQGLLHILAHEYCHALHGDGFWAFLRCALAALWWFDPLVWAAAFAARQDSDLACDEAAVILLGEEERFAYGRTLLALLQGSMGKTECPGMPLMLSGSERGVKERIMSLAKKNKAEAVVLAAVLSMVFLICGCAFTGAENPTEEADAVFVEEAVGPALDEPAKDPGSLQTERASSEDTDEKGSPKQAAELEDSADKEAERAAFAEALADYADSGLSEDRRVDVQHFYEYNAGKREDAPEEGWYLLCRDDGEDIFFYGLYTEGFGCRGVKTMIGEEVNAFDLVWYPCYMNGDSKNIRVLERAQDGRPRRFVWKYVEEESSDTEVWRLAGGVRQDTGAMDLKVLSQEEYLSWAQWHLTFDVDQEKEQARVYYDGSENALAGILDISAYQDFEVEEVQIGTDIVAFDLDSQNYEEDAREDYEKLAIHLVPGLKLKGFEELWIYGLSPISVQLFWDEGEDGFRMGKPKVDEQYSIQNPTQERKLEEMKSGASAAAGNASESGQAGEKAAVNTLAVPLTNDAEKEHYDLEVVFVNPCPDYDRISEGYGGRTHPLTGEVRMHNGVDMAAPAGADIVAAAEGTVYRVGFDAENGNYVALWHGQSGQMTYYAHCGETLVEEGDRVAAGQKIAVVGKTGRATGNMLHFAVSYGENWQEPRWENSRE